MADQRAVLRVRAALTTSELKLNDYYEARQALREAIMAVPELAPLLQPSDGQTQDQWLEAVHRSMEEHLDVLR